MTTKLLKTQFWLKITTSFLFLSFLIFLTKSLGVNANESNHDYIQSGDIVYPLKKTVESKTSKFMRMMAFSGLYVSKYHNNLNSIDLRGKHFVSDIYFNLGRYQRINILVATDNLTGKYEERNTKVTWSKFTISYEYWYRKKFAIKPGYIFQSNLDPLYEIIQSKVSAHGLSLCTIIRPLNSIFISSGCYILKLSSSSNFSDYGIFAEVMKYLRAYDWCLIRGYFNSNSIFNSRSMMGRCTYHFRFPGELGKIFYKLGVGLGNDNYGGGKRINNIFLLNEIKYNLTKQLAISLFYERKWSIYIKNQFGIHLQHSFLINK